MLLSPHFSEEEFIRSSTAEKLKINNHFQNEQHRQNAAQLCLAFLEPLRAELGSPIIITSGYRSPKLNRLVGGSESSAHLCGQAADFMPKEGTLAEAFNALLALAQKKQIPPFDQLIWEFGRWIHLGISALPRQQILAAERQKQGTAYRSIQKAPAP